MQDPDTLLAIVARALGVRVADLTGRSRARRIGEARILAAYVLRTQIPALSQEAIGDLLGGRDHSTIGYALERAPALLAADPVRAAALAPLLPAARPAPRPLNATRAMRWWAAQAQAEYFVRAA